MAYGADGDGQRDDIITRQIGGPADLKLHLPPEQTASNGIVMSLIFLLAYRIRCLEMPNVCLGRHHLKSGHSDQSAISWGRELAASACFLTDRSNSI